MWKPETFSAASLLGKSPLKTILAAFITEAGSNVENPVENVENDVKTLFCRQKLLLQQKGNTYENR